MNALFKIPGLNVYLQILVTLISISVHQLVSRRRRRKESILKIIVIFTIGLSGWFTIMNGLFGQIVYGNEVAELIGWPGNSGFQMELGFVSIGIGIVGFFGFWRREYWVPFIVIKTSFGWGAGITHILHAVQRNNFSPGNTGIILYWDFLFPLLMIVLYLLFRAGEQKKENPKKPGFKQ